MRWGLTDEKIEHLRAYFAQHPKVARVLIHGSRTKGTHKRTSDIDLICEGPQLNGRDIAHMLYAMNEDLPLIEMIELQDKKNITHAGFLAEVEKHGEVLYERA